VNSSIVGILNVVATPIGNLKDITFRAIEMLKAVDLIVAEDTRHCKVLLNHYGITTPALSLHEYNEKEQVQKLVQQLLSGKSLALVSDAGTPLISDPGYRLVLEAQQAGVRVVPIPGACAAISALSVCGLATDKFVFEGFLPVKSAARKARLEQLHGEQRTLIFYEAPHRIIEVLTDMNAIFGADRRAVLAREMTKLFETVHGDCLAELLKWVENDKDQQRGEMVLVVAGNTAEKIEVVSLKPEKILDILLNELPLNQAVKLTCEITGEKKNKLYKQAINQQGLKDS
jgi:16S rRNA (cytidine1402-2'-O)-methyltransferase